VLKMRLSEERDVKIRFHHEHDPKTGAFLTHVAEDYRLVNGVTVCKIFETYDGEEHSYMGWAECSVKDRYDKEIGRKVSLKRALFNAGFEYEDRKEIWGAYFQRKENSNGTAVNTGTV